MFKKILYPTDFSEDAKKALEYVKKLKMAGTEDVVILHVMESSHIEAMTTSCEWMEGDTEKCIEKMEERLKKEAKNKLNEIAKELSVNTKTVLKIGKPFMEILKTAEEEKVSLIVMGSHGMGKIEELLIGSVTENVIRHTKVPVLVVKRYR